MSEQDRCPKCGFVGEPIADRAAFVSMPNGTIEPMPVHIVGGMDCLRRQLAQARAKALDKAASALEQLSMLDIITGKEHPAEIIRRMADEADAE